MAQQSQVAQHDVHTKQKDGYPKKATFIWDSVFGLLSGTHMPWSGWNVLCSESKWKVGVLRLKISYTLSQKKAHWHFQGLQELAGTDGVSLD